MQIVAGWAKGMRCEAPAGDKTRPTGAKVRAAVFNILQERVADAEILDLFAGSGAVGIEALSRGAKAAVFVEKAPPALKALRRNLAELARRAAAQQLPVPSADVEAADAERVLARLTAGARRFDLVYMDPPYREAARLTAALGGPLAAACRGGALLVLETAAEDAPGEGLGAAWALVKQRTYGDTMVSVWERLEEG